jgi:hypothetical protein
LQFVIFPHFLKITGSRWPSWCVIYCYNCVKSFFLRMIHPHCVLGNKNHSRFRWTKQFIYSVSTQHMFRPNRPSSGWQAWKIKYTILNGNRIPQFLTFIYIAYNRVELSNYVLQCWGKVNKIMCKVKNYG